MIEVLDEVEAYPGNHWAFAVTVRESIDSAAPTPMNLTGVALKATIGGSPGWTGTPAVIDVPTGEIEVQVPPADTVGFGPGAYLCDVLATRSGIPRTAVRFWIVVKPVGSKP